jgi:hypothetical protein
LPVRKIGDVLLELANGNKDVDVPYADRGDEVGDNARAAKTFKENLLRIEMIQAQQKETVSQPLNGAEIVGGRRVHRNRPGYS